MSGEAPTVSDRVRELARESLGKPMARRIDVLCRLVAEAEARQQIAETECRHLRAELAAATAEAEDAVDGGLGLSLELAEANSDRDRLAARVHTLTGELHRERDLRGRDVTDLTAARAEVERLRAEIDRWAGMVTGMVSDRGDPCPDCDCCTKSEACPPGECPLAGCPCGED